ncbi:hypothetical protein [Arthrobacter sedimenti]|uniref:hypothetical protein n=1 Tax=Arthrobacter sedimenti TaxID=2694931 RepID=UPI001121D31B|nr:hypothetical protein [Arthrobacter sedimenti]
MKNALFPTLTVAALLLTGCSSAETAASSEDATPAPTVSVAPASPSAEPEDSATAAPTPERNERGDIIKTIGENGGWKAVEGGPNTINFKVTSIAPAVCDNPYPGEANGIPMAVTLEIETTADFEGPISVNGVPGQISFSPYYWKGYADNGTRMNTVDSNINKTCLANEALLLPDYVGKGEKLNGQVILDVTTPTGTISYSPDGGSGWVWEYPSAG